MFQARGRETEHTSQWESGVGHSKTSARSSREHAEAEISFPSLSRAREAVPAARFWVLEGTTLFRPRARRPDSGRQPKECSTFAPPEPRTQPRAAGQPHRLEQKTTFQPSDTFHCNLVRRLVSVGEFFLKIGHNARISDKAAPVALRCHCGCDRRAPRSTLYWFLQVPGICSFNLTIEVQQNLHVERLTN